MGFFNKKKQDKDSVKEDKSKIISNPSPTSNVTTNTKTKSKQNNEVEDNLKKLNELKPEYTQAEDFKQIDSTKDPTKKDKKSLISKAYDYWVWIFQDGRRVSSFGVTREEYAGVNLLIRREEKGGQKKVVFRELFPESSFSLENIKKKKKQYKEELNKLKQIERRLEENLISNQPKEYNYDIADIKLKIKDLEIKLQSIRYGVQTEYVHKDFRDDGIPVIIYTLENGELHLWKKVKEQKLFTEASENKKIESHEAKQQIDKEFQTKDNRDWLKIATIFAYILVLGILAFCAWEWMNYNQEQAFNEFSNKFDKVLSQNERTMSGITEEVSDAYKQDRTFQNELIKQNQEIINSCLSNSGNIPVSR